MSDMRSFIKVSHERFTLILRNRNHSEGRKPCD